MLTYVVLMMIGLPLWAAAASGADQVFSLRAESYGSSRIVLPPDADHMKLFAARELQHHLQLVLEVEVPIVEDGVRRDGAFLVGIRPTSDNRPLAVEEARYLVTETDVYLYGDDLVRRQAGDPFHSSTGGPSYFNLGGTQFAVYDFLERELGIRWLEPGDEGVFHTPREELSLAVGGHSWVSPFAYQRGMRSYAWGWTQEDPGYIPATFVLTGDQARERREELDLWLRRMRMGAKERLQYGHAFYDWWEKYGEEHPEYFALNGRGQREPIFSDRPDRVKICPSEPGVVRQAVDDWLVRRERDALRNKAVCVAVNDGGGGGAAEYCHCERCRALDVSRAGEAFGDHLTDRYLYLANRTLKAARARVPDALVTAYAYSQLLQPPRRERVAEGVVLQFVTAMNTPFAATRKLYEDWKAAGVTQFMFRPNDLYAEMGLPLGQEERLFRHQQLAIQQGAQGTDYDCIEGFWTGVSGLTYYVLARSHVDPAQDFAYWEEEYTAAFGAAQPQVREYFRHWRRKFDQVIYPADLEAQASGGTGGFLQWHQLGAIAAQIRHFYSSQDFEMADSLLQEGLAQELTPLQRRQLQRLVLANQHSRLTFQAMAAVADRDDAETLSSAQQLLDFRLAARDSLRYNWWLLFSEQHQMGDAAGIALLLNQERLAGRKSFTCVASSSSEPPVIDGRLDEALWARARNGVGFVTNAAASPPRASAEAMLAYDARNLYLAVECQEPRMDAVVEKESNRDGTVWEDNAVEIFVDPAHGGKTFYYHLIVSSAGVLFDSRMEGGESDQDWNLAIGSQLEYAVGKSETGWVVEMRLPFRSLAMASPRTGDQIRFNVTRDRAVEGEKRELTALSPTFGGFHMPQCFAELRFE